MRTGLKYLAHQPLYPLFITNVFKSPAGLQTPEYKVI